MQLTNVHTKCVGGVFFFFFGMLRKGNQNRGREEVPQREKGSMTTSRAEIPLPPKKEDSTSEPGSGSQCRRGCRLLWRGPAELL